MPALVLSSLNQDTDSPSMELKRKMQFLASHVAN